MRLRIALVIFALCCECLAIRIPIWDSDSESESAKYQQPVESIPIQYFQYPANKPQFAVDVAAFHGVPNPHEHFKAYPVRPFTGVNKPELGKHKLQDANNPVFQKFQEYTQLNEDVKTVVDPAASNYEVFHPYKAEEPGLQEIYKDPVLDKIRNDILNSQTRLQEYEKEVEKPDVASDEYLESVEQTDKKKLPQKNIPVPYEIHRPLRKPMYYRATPINSHDHILNQRFRHPWNQQNVKIRPMHYRPLKNHIAKLRQNHAMKYDDEHNEYPSLPYPKSYSEPSDGYDIYERGKEKYKKLRDNVDESINNAIKENRPTTYQKLEIQNNDEAGEENEEFIPIKNYAQVRKTETTRHLPKLRAFDDAESFDELENAPRLREAIKSTKAQTVYTEEGYEDAAYDHAGEQKHAAENEAHAGLLREKEKSGGYYKTPSYSSKYEDASGAAYRDQVLDGKKWKNDEKNDKEEKDSDDYSEDDMAQSIEADVYEDVTGQRSKREDVVKESEIVSQDSKNINSNIMQRSTDIKSTNTFIDKNSEQTYAPVAEQNVGKQETYFTVPELDLNTTFLTEEEIYKLAQLKAPQKKENIKDKYPYYFANLRQLSKDSPLRYAENLKFIPKKSKGGTEFYDSRSRFECPEVDDDVDPIPAKLKEGEAPESNENNDNKNNKKGEANTEILSRTNRLKGLGDKIDCFKVKYFGENPLDSPFFKEDIISNPEPITLPNLPIYKSNFSEKTSEQAKLKMNVFNQSEKLKEDATSDILTLLDKLNNNQRSLQNTLIKTNTDLMSSLLAYGNNTTKNNTRLFPQNNFYSDVLNNIKNNLNEPLKLNNNSNMSNKFLESITSDKPVTYNFYKNKEDVIQVPIAIRNKRSTAFVYEPYKTVRDGQFQNSKKATTSVNVSPLIKQLQSSKVIDRVTKTVTDKGQPVKRNVAFRAYKDIGKNDRIKPSKGTEPIKFESFIDVNEDKRRGEPRYEIRRPTNHKIDYSPVENKKVMSIEDYEARKNYTQSTAKSTTEASQIQISSQRQPRIRMPTVSTLSTHYDVSSYLPKLEDSYRSASTAVKKIVKSPSIDRRHSVDSKNQSNKNNKNRDKDYAEYDEEEQDTVISTTAKPLFRRRLTTTTSTEKPEEEPEPELIVPKLRLITRFRSTTAVPTTQEPEKSNKNPTQDKPEDEEIVAPKYREKKKKSSKSTLVTDTETYGDDEDDMMKDEVDAMIGVQQDMDEYIPRYEKEIERQNKEREKDTSSSSSSEEYDDDDNNDEEDSEEDVEDDDNEEEEEEEDLETVTTTLEPLKRTLPQTTEAPVTTTEAHSAKLELQPIVKRKKIEIHKELPVNKSSPHTTQFKQDIKEIEIIKELPMRTPKPLIRKLNKNIELLDLYKDDDLAKDINKLGAVEVFKENLDLRKGPKHGGNYRSAKLLEMQEVNTTPQPMHGGNLKAPADTETSQTYSNPIELDDVLPAVRLHGGNLRSISHVSRARSKGKNAKLELADMSEETEKTPLKPTRTGIRRSRLRGNTKREKLIELEDDAEERDDNDNYGSMHGGNFKTFESRNDGRYLHGGNYKNAKIVQVESDEDSSTPRQNDKVRTTNTKNNAAVILNSFVQAAPILSSTPAYILDPSKRMYYYVDA